MTLCVWIRLKNVWNRDNGQWSLARIDWAANVFLLPSCFKLLYARYIFCCQRHQKHNAHDVNIHQPHEHFAFEGYPHTPSYNDQVKKICFVGFDWIYIPTNTATIFFPAFNAHVILANMTSNVDCESYTTLESVVCLMSNCRLEQIWHQIVKSKCNPRRLETIHLRN